MSTATSPLVSGVPSTSQDPPTESSKKSEVQKTMAAAPSGLDTGVNKHVKAAKKTADKQNSKDQESLAQSKGRAQITATTAMSIVNVALLKSVIDQGPDNNRFYIASLALITSSLALQVIAGGISIFIEYTLSYMNKYGQNCCQDWLKNCCPLRCVKKSSTSQEHGDPSKNIEMNANDEKFMSNDRDWDIGSYDPESGSPQNQRSMQSCDCFGYTCSTENVDEHLEANALKRYMKWECRRFEIELKAIRVGAELERDAGLIEEYNKEIEKLTANQKAESEGKKLEDIQKRIKDLEQKLNSVGIQKNDHESILRKAEINKQQGKLLKECAKSIRKSNVLRMASFWQHILNLVFYVIFVMNAFIIGFGIAASQNNQGQEPVVTPATNTSSQ